MPDVIRLHSGLTLLEARQIADRAHMHLIGNGFDIVISPIVLPGWHVVPIHVKPAAPATPEREAA